MKFAIYYVEQSAEKPTVYTKKFSDFGEAVQYYTLFCATCSQVVLVNLNSQTIIRHYVCKTRGNEIAVCTY